MALFPSSGRASSLTRTIALDSNFALEVASDGEGNVSTKILFGSSKELVEQLTVSNGELESGDIQKLVPKSNDRSELILLAIYNRTSNYDARTGIVVYRKRWWRLAIVPFER